MGGKLGFKSRSGEPSKVPGSRLRMSSGDGASKAAALIIGDV